MKPLMALVLCGILLVIDVLSKTYTVDHIAPLIWSSPVFPYGGVPIFQDWYGIDFSLNYVMNKGAAWGMLASFQQPLLYARLLIIGGVFSYLLFGKPNSLKQFSLCLVLTGAVGNVLDFFFYGYVVDMFHFVFWGYSYPVFNCADAFIFLGICMLFVQSCLHKGKSSSPQKKTT